MSVAYANYLNNGGTPVVDIGGLPSGRPGAFPGAPTSFEPPMAQAGAVDPSTGTHMVPVPFPSLVNFGVQAETVRQLTEMKAYLWRHVRSCVFLFVDNVTYFHTVSTVWLGFEHLSRSDCCPWYACGGWSWNT